MWGKKKTGIALFSISSRMAPQYILGISCFYHDAAACLLKDGRVIAAAQEERFTRKKHDAKFPSKAIEFCLREAGITPKELTGVGFYEKPFLKFDRILTTFLAVWPRGFLTFLRVLPMWIKERLWTKHVIKKNLPGYEGEIVFIEHHLSHAASSFFCSPFEEAAVLTIDGVGEWTSAAWGIGHGNVLEMKEEMRFPHSLGLLYSTFTAYLGFEVNEGEYKVMGLAPYGKPRYLDSLRKIAHLNDDGSLWLDMKFFEYQHGQASFGKRFVELFGPARNPSSDECRTKRVRPEATFLQHDYDIARTIQEFCEEAMVKMAEHVFSKTHTPNLCLAGGVALNCVGNSRIKEKTPFKNIFVQPAAGDAGGALGVAYYMWNTIMNQPRIKDFGVPYFGSSYSDEAVETFLKENNISYQGYEPSELVIQVAEHLASGRVIGWFQGKMEFGPRALGHRSILADPRPPEMRDTVNLKIKFRESFRPFAPAVMLEKAKEWFEWDDESPHMLFTANARLEKAGEIPAVVHLDRSARIQTVRHEHDPLFHELICEFEKLTGVPIILNTSFNRRGEPIVESLQNAYDCFMGSGIDVLVLNRFIIHKS